jgi:hypothetical protein
LIILVFLKARCSSSSLLLDSNEVSEADDNVDQLDSNERNDDPANAIDEEIAPQDACRADGPIGYPSQRKGNERYDDQRVENDG